MNLVITLTTAGTDTGPFNIYSDVDGFLNAFDTNIDRATLLAGFATGNVPDGTLEVRVQSVNELCTNYSRGGVIPLEFRFEPEGSHYVIDFIDKGSSTYFYGYFTSYKDGIDTNPANIIIKLTEDRSVESSFAIGEGIGDSIVYIGQAIVEDPDGKILLSGNFTNYQNVSANGIVRINPDGSRDNTFNVGTGFSNYATGIARDSQGRYLVAGKFNSYNGSTANRFCRLLNDGSFDSSFNIGSGFSTVSVWPLISENDDVIVTHYGGTFNGTTLKGGIVKLNGADGSVNTTFNTTIGTGFNSGNNQTIILRRIPNENSFYAGGLYTAFNGTSYGGIVKMSDDGVIDNSFNSGGAGFNGGGVWLLWIIWDGKILVNGPFTTYNGTATNNWIILNPDGSIFLTFAPAYGSIFTVGNNLMAQTYVGNLEIIYTYVP